jgi:hypothetical protein
MYFNETSMHVGIEIIHDYISYVFFILTTILSRKIEFLNAVAVKQL